MTPNKMSEHLAATNRIFEEEVVAKRDFTALAHVYTKTARILPPGSETVTGLEAIQSFWQTAVEGLQVTAVKLSTVEHEHVGETIIELGRADLHITGAPEPMVVKYVVVWKQEDGQWKWDIDIWNTVV